MSDSEILGFNEMWGALHCLEAHPLLVGRRERMTVGAIHVLCQGGLGQYNLSPPYPSSFPLVWSEKQELSRRRACRVQGVWDSVVAAAGL